MRMVPAFPISAGLLLELGVDVLGLGAPHATTASATVSAMTPCVQSNLTSRGVCGGKASVRCLDGSQSGCSPWGGIQRLHEQGVAWPKAGQHGSTEKRRRM